MQEQTHCNSHEYSCTSPILGEVDGRIQPPASASKPCMRDLPAHGSSDALSLSLTLPLHGKLWGLTFGSFGRWVLSTRSDETGPALRAYRLLLTPTSFGHPPPRQHIRGITPGLSFWEDPPSTVMRVTPAPRGRDQCWLLRS